MTMTLNEEHNIEGLINSYRACNPDEIVICDDGSTDRTREIAQDMGATVYMRDKHIIIPTEADVRFFTRYFGWEPTFSPSTPIMDGSACRNESVGRCQGEWVLFLDADERIAWDEEEASRLMDESDQINCMYYYAHDGEGRPTHRQTLCKMFRKTHSLHDGLTHDVILPSGRQGIAEKMHIDHWQKEGHTQDYVKKIMEYSVATKGDPRSLFYLGREYFYTQEFDRALTMFDYYLSISKWEPEITEAWMFKAKCYWLSMRGDEARACCLEAIRRNPDHKNALYLMADLYYEPNKSKWLRIAENATDTDVLFGTDKV